MYYASISFKVEEKREMRTLRKGIDMAMRRRDRDRLHYPVSHQASQHTVSHQPVRYQEPISSQHNSEPSSHSGIPGASDSQHTSEPSAVRIPVSHQPVSIPVSHQPVSIPVSHQPVSIPVSHQPVSIPVSHQPVSIPVSHQPVSIPVSHQPVSIPVSHQPVTWVSKKIKETRKNIKKCKGSTKKDKEGKCSSQKNN